MASSSTHHSYSRKQKSLGLLCNNFLNLYNKKGVQLVSIDDSALRLGVERRRIYDIVNILESIGVLKRKAKNQYTWKGFSAIPAALQELKNEGTKENLEFLDGSNDNAKISDDEEEEKTLATPGSESQGDKSKLKSTSDSTAPDNAKISDDEEEEETFATLGSESQGDKSKLKSTSDSTAPDKSSRNENRSKKNRREKSLALLTQSFVKLFVCSNISMITLEEAAKLLLGKESKHSTALMRTRVRRLYDIANVLSTMNLIEKTCAADSRKPAFRWLGFIGERSSESVDKAYNSNMNTPGKRKFGSDITNIGFERNKVHLFMDGQNSKTQNEKEKENEKEIINCEAQPDKSNLEKDAKQTSKSYIFGPFAPAACVPEIGTSENKSVKQVHDWESLAQVHRPSFCRLLLSLHGSMEILVLRNCWENVNENFKIYEINAVFTKRDDPLVDACSPCTNTVDNEFASMCFFGRSIWYRMILSL